MTDAIKAWVLRIFRVPGPPRLPAGDPGAARVFRAGVNYWRLKWLSWGAHQAVTFTGLVMMVSFLHNAPPTVELRNKKGASRTVDISAALAVLRGVEVVSLGLWLVQLPLTLAVVRLDYEMRWYVVTDRAARLREGILRVKEMTFTLANVQDIRLRQGPLQRLLGLADVELRTAGGSEPVPGKSPTTENLHLARFRCVDAEVAGTIRELVRQRIERARNTGLGDPDEGGGEPPAVVADSGDLLAAAREMTRESAALREVARRLSS